MYASKADRPGGTGQRFTMQKGLLLLQRSSSQVRLRHPDVGWSRDRVCQAPSLQPVSNIPSPWSDRSQLRGDGSPGVPGQQCQTLGPLLGQVLEPSASLQRRMEICCGPHSMHAPLSFSKTGYMHGAIMPSVQRMAASRAGVGREDSGQGQGQVPPH